MSRRKRRGDNSSLELLLDTITNTFGGILFIAILLSLLLRSSSSTSSDTEPEGPPITAVEQAELETRVADLQQEAELLRRRISSASTPERGELDERLLGQLTAAAAEVERAVAQRAEALRNTVELQREAASAEAEVESIEEDQKAAEQILAEAESRIAAAREEAAELAEAALAIDRPLGETDIEQTVSLPSLRPSFKNSVGLYIRFGKVFVMHQWRNGERQGPNTDQFVIVDLPAGGGVEQVARPRPATGTPITAQTIVAEMRRLLQGFPPGSFVITVVVFEDSFDVFQLLKSAIVQLGYEYRPIPLQPGDSVVDFGGRGEAQ